MLFLEIPFSFAEEPSLGSVSAQGWFVLVHFCVQQKPTEPGAAHLGESEGDCSCQLRRSFNVKRRLEISGEKKSLNGNSESVAEK